MRVPGHQSVAGLCESLLAAGDYSLAGVSRSWTPAGVAQRQATQLEGVNSWFSE